MKPPFIKNKNKINAISRGCIRQKIQSKSNNQTSSLGLVKLSGEANDALLKVRDESRANSPCYTSLRTIKVQKTRPLSVTNDKSKCGKNKQCYNNFVKFIYTNFN